MLRIRALTAVTGVALAASLAGPAVADPTTYSGEFSGLIRYTRCEVSAGRHVAGGTWRVNLHEDMATARFVITVDGQPHVAWTAPMTRVPSDRSTFVATIVTGAGPLEISLTGGQFSYVIAPYDLTAYGGAKCASVTYSGMLTS